AVLVPVPTEASRRLRISQQQGDDLLVRYLEIPADRDQETPLVVEDFRVTTLVARLRGLEGEPMRGTLAIEPTESDLADFEMQSQAPDFIADEVDASVEARTPIVGRLRWMVVPADGTFGTVEGTVDVEQPGMRIDLGTIQVSHRAPANLLLMAPPECQTAWVHTGRRLVSADLWAGGGSGALVIPELREGDAIRVDFGARYLPVALHLAGPQPWRAGVPEGSLSCRVTDPTGEPLTAAVAIVDGHPSDGTTNDRGYLLLQGLAAGPHRLVIAASGFKARVLEFKVRDAEHRHFEVSLPRRP
ncbi:MAG: carboxypeptidase regulatory-like domain-containing protein, partial [Planctomycetes bacterium]|nr:carboxypeptidase regulatory-like domain-containing protein [Planctomycetota bacterium]